MSPSGSEVALTALLVVLAVHLVALVVLLVLAALDRVRVPRGELWVAILMLVPVLGPAMVLLRGRRSGGDTAGE